MKEEEDTMPQRTSPDLTSKMRGYTRRLSARMHLSPADRLNLQLSHSPVGVLGAGQPAH